jgi:hypothetical protein
MDIKDSKQYTILQTVYNTETYISFGSSYGSKKIPEKYNKYISNIQGGDYTLSSTYKNIKTYVGLENKNDIKNYSCMFYYENKMYINNFIHDNIGIMKNGIEYIQFDCETREFEARSLLTNNLINSIKIVNNSGGANFYFDDSINGIYIFSINNTQNCEIYIMDLTYKVLKTFNFIATSYKLYNIKDCIIFQCYSSGVNGIPYINFYNHVKDKLIRIDASEVKQVIDDYKLIIATNYSPVQEGQNTTYKFLALKLITFEKIKTGKECIICNEEVEEKEVVILPCGHTNLHKKCINETEGNLVICKCDGDIKTIVDLK